LADRAKFLAAGDELPGPGPFTVYRGVAGCGKARRIRGLSWTLSLQRAAWFANRFRLADPAVYRLTADDAQVLAYLNTRYRNEEELLILVGETKPVRCLADVELIAAAEVHEAAMQAANRARLDALRQKS
jgi:hypothetical protein